MHKRLMILILLGLILISGATFAQDAMPEGCEIPNLDDAFAEAAEAITDGDVVAYLDTMDEATMILNDSRKACLQGAVSGGADLSGVKVTHAHLYEGELGSANLAGADLQYSNLETAFLYGANLEGAHLKSAELMMVYFERANLQDAELANTNMAGARLRRANLQDASITRANLTLADMREVNLQGVLLHFANLKGANLAGANLQEANLGYANLQEANLTGANLQGVYSVIHDDMMAEVYFQGADLSGANLEGTIPGVFICDETTILPDGSNWTPDTDMTRFSDPEHSDFWRSDNPNSPAYGGESG